MEPFGQAVLATDGALGFDCDVPLSAVDVMAFAAAGFSWVARYLSRGAQARHDLQAVEVRTIHMAGLATVLVQHVAPPGWQPSKALGDRLGNAAQKNATSIGCPVGVTVWCDLEGVAASVGSAAVIGFVNAWSHQVEASGYTAGLYVGADPGLGSDDLYRALSPRHYWRGLSRSIPAVAVRGFQITQSAGSNLSGVSFDRDTIVRDRLGDLPTWWSA